MTTPVAGIIAEYNPFHNGHAHHIALTRQRLGGDCPVVAVMSGNFVQRGDVAVAQKITRAASAIEGGADLVVELPLPFSLAPAEIFALGGVDILTKTNLITHLSFGCECGERAELERAADVLLSPEYPARLKLRLAEGKNYPAACADAARELDPATAETISYPNNLLAVEYIKALRSLGSPIIPLPIPRGGPGHDGGLDRDFPSASAIRRLLLGGQYDELGLYMPPAALRRLTADIGSKRCPADANALLTAIRYCFLRMDAAEIARLPGVAEGLENRIVRAVSSFSGGSFEGLCSAVKTSRYSLARVRRIMLSGFTGLTRPDQRGGCPYFRPLAFNGRGRELLSRLRDNPVPTLTKPAALGGLTARAAGLTVKEALADDLWLLSLGSDTRGWGRFYTTSPLFLR